jgi:hypothetical protein
MILRPSLPLFAIFFIAALALFYCATTPFGS